jgi:hypothetical protein
MTLPKLTRRLEVINRRHQGIEYNQSIQSEQSEDKNIKNSGFIPGCFSRKIIKKENQNAKD